MASFFGFGAFSTPVGQLIERATDNGASAGNLSLHLQICDIVNETDSGPKDSVAALRKRLTGSAKNFHIINLSLTVLETCVKNCGLRFHAKIAQKEFLVDLMKVIHPKNNPPTIVKERVLGLLQYWADAFRGKPQLVAVEEMYDQMKAEGVEFPPIDLDSLAPVETPTTRGSSSSQQTQPGGQLQLHQQGHSPGQTRSSSGQSRSPGQSRSQGRRVRMPAGPLKPEQVAKLLSEFDVVRQNMDIMNEIMSENEPGKENPEDLQLLEELNRTVHSMQLRVAGLIERCQDEIVLESTLIINDDLNSLFVRYDRWLKNSAAAKAPLPGQQATAPAEAGQTVATTSLMTATDATNTISYPSLDEPPPPSYEASSTAQPNGVGQLIDLGTDITASPPPPQDGKSDDIVAQLAQMGVTTQPQPTTTTTAPQDEFDMFAQSRTAYGTNQQSSTYDDNMIQQNASLSAAVRGRGMDAPNPDQPYSNLTDWLAQTDLQATPTTQPPESATSAEFDQFLAQRATKGESLPAERPRPQMQKAEAQSDELFSL